MRALRKTEICIVCFYNANLLLKVLNQNGNLWKHQQITQLIVQNFYSVYVIVLSLEIYYRTCPLQVQSIEKFRVLRVIFTYSVID